MQKLVKQSLRADALKNYWIEFCVFIFAALTRFINLGYPPSHYFDEVYHVFTAQQMFRGNPAAWEWWNTPPQGFAYEWTHPPLAKEFMWFAISIFGDNSFAWRFFSALFGTGAVILIYFIALELFKNRKIALLSSIVASLSGLLLVMSRIGMNDSYFLFFSLLALFLFLKNKNFWMGIALGLSITSKWTGIFTVGIILISYLVQNYKNLLNNFKILNFLFPLIIIPLVVYIASYTPFFLGHHSPPGLNYSNFQTFVGLQQQMYWYHTRLKATHSYQSRPEQWIFDLRPVWLFVNYERGKISEIYTLENPFIAWFGLISVIFLVFKFFEGFDFRYFAVLAPYFLFFVPWFFSPRIMFNYHYLPSTVFLTISIGVVLNELMKKKQGVLALTLLSFSLFLFIYFYPLWTGIHVPIDFNQHYFWLQSWK